MSKPAKTQTQRRMNRKDLDSSVHRLSRVREQYKANKAVQDERHESFVLNYYKQNPQEMDTRAPEEKLKEIQERLNDDDVEKEERHKLLSQQKQLCYFAHGEDSSEMVSCERQLGMYYNRNKRPASAVRHLQKAQQLQQTNNVDPEEGMEIAVEMAEAHLAMRDANKRQETMKHMSQANDALKPVMGVEVENLRLMYRRDLAQARVTTTRGRFEKALEQYETAAASLERCSGSDNAEMANLYVEMADVAEADENEERAGHYYRLAYNKYVSLGMDDEAKAIEPKLPQPEEEEVREGASGVQSDVQREASDVQRPNTPGYPSSGAEEKKSSSSSDSSHHEDKKSDASHHSEAKSDGHSDHDKKSDASHHSDHEHDSDKEKHSDHEHVSDKEKSEHEHDSDKEKKSEHDSDKEKKASEHDSDKEKKASEHDSDKEKKSEHEHESDKEKKSDHSKSSEHDAKKSDHESDKKSEHDEKPNSSDTAKKSDAANASEPADEKSAGDSDHEDTDKKSDASQLSESKKSTARSTSSKSRHRHKHHSSRPSSAKRSDPGANDSEKPEN